MKKNKIVGITFGSFDLCHYGHALMFEECKEYCDYLIVVVQSDPSIDRPEKNKPIQSHKERIGIVSSLKFVDKVIEYDTEADLIEVLKNIQPAKLSKKDEQTEDNASSAIDTIGLKPKPAL